MKISQIRPDHLVKLARVAYEKDIAFYLVNQDRFVVRVCPACALQNDETYFEKEGFEYSRCAGCGSVYMNPGPPEKLINKFYKNSKNYEFWAEFMYPQSKAERLLTIHKERADWVVSNLRKRFPNQNQFVILELGAGTGDSLATIAKIGGQDFIGFAIEPNQSMQSYLRENGIQVIQESALEAAKFKHKFDAVVSFEVLEHLLKPGLYLSLFARTLKKNGLFFATTPNANSIEIQLLQENSTSIDIEHISVLTPAGMQALALLNGYRVEEIITPGEFDIELIREVYAKFSINISENSTPEDSQSLIQACGFSSHMRCILSLKKSR